MDVEVFVPEAFTGEVIGDLNARGGFITFYASRFTPRAYRRYNSR
jgi:translation elongation factor EF-G